MKKLIKVVLLFAVMSMVSVLPTQAGTKHTISTKERNRYFSQSAFIGSSIGLGLKNYARTQKRGYLGGPTWLVQGCYSFMNDSRGQARYRIHYKGRVYKAKDAVAASKVKRVFISMGTNDMWKPVDKVYKDYVSYVEGIRKRNPKVVVFIESTTPMRSSRNGRYLNNKAIKTLNQKMEQYCEQKKDVYYIDVAKGMYDAKGGLKKAYSSDGYVHLTNAAYKVWMKNVTAYVDQLLYNEKQAKAAVKHARKTRTKKDYKKAGKLIKKLEPSTVKTSLKKQWKKIRVIEPKPVTTEDPAATKEPATTEAEMPE